uniref:Uncharacterized protein n=1 Tax=Kalanchoe fedtschenkoi TaxID=63787 RepID=A0A7N0ZX51_KALFE
MDTTKLPKKLDFNAPLLSTRRVMCRSISSRTSGSHTAERVPFCWEQVPGKPRDDMHRTTPDENLPPQPKPPPSQWHPVSSFGLLAHSSTRIQLSDGFEEKGTFSDMLSLSEAIDFVEREAEKKAESHHGHGLDGFDSKTAASSDCEDNPSFIIQRFLPAATALAASSVVNNAWNKHQQQELKHGTSGCSSYDEREMRAHASGCGLENLFTWRIKHKPCGIRSPVRESSNSVNLKCQRLRGRSRPPFG